MRHERKGLGASIAYAHGVLTLIQCSFAARVDPAFGEGLAIMEAMTATSALSLPLLLGLSSLAGCSLLYNPNNLDDLKIDAAPPADAPTDIDIEMPMVTAVGPADLYEGQGTGGSRQAVLAVVGGNISPTAIVELLGRDGTPLASTVVTVDNAHAVRSASGTAIAVPVTVPIDTAVGDQATRLTVRVTQMGATGMVSGALADAVTLHNLPELTAPVTSSAALAPAYSRVELGAAMTLAATGPAARVRAYGDIVLTDLHADGAAPASGPGGAAGGSTQPSNGSGAGAGRASTLTSTASGAGFATAGAAGAGLTPVAGGAAYGDDLLTNFASSSCIGSGGGGGGNAGGGSGGAVEITAGGTLTLATATANGGSVSNAGGGSGGSIVLRAGAALTVTGTITTAGGAASNGGDGGTGRVRYDSPQRTLSVAIVGAGRRGVQFDVAEGQNPLITTSPRQTFQLVSAPAATPFNMFVLNADGVTTDSGTIVFGSATAIYTPRLALNFGYNQICVTPPTGNPTITESANCISVAYVP